MKKDRLLCSLALACTTIVSVSAQGPLTPLWMHVYPFGAGSVLINDVLSTRVAYDHGTDRLYRSILIWNPTGGYQIQVFDPEGNDLTPSSPIVIQGIQPGDYQVTHIMQLSVTNDTLSAIVRGEVYGSTTDDLNWLKVLSTYGNPLYLLGYGSVPLNAFHRDAMGTLVLTDNELHSYTSTGWPAGSIATPPAQRIAVLGNDLVIGTPPSISRINRSNLTALATIDVPSSGMATTGVCIANGSSAFNYAALNSNGVIDVGLADINSGLIWSTTISIPSQALPTAFHVDEQGDFWVAVAHNATGTANLGLLYRFRSTGGTVAVNSFSRSIDGIASASSRLFLTGRVTGTTQSTYLAAFDVDLITQDNSLEGSSFKCYPNPATNQLHVVGQAPGTLHLFILDATGRNVRELSGPFMESQILDVTDLPNGSYLLRSSGNVSTMTRPFSIVR